MAQRRSSSASESPASLPPVESATDQAPRRRRRRKRSRSNGESAPPADVSAEQAAAPAVAAARERAPEGSANGDAPRRKRRRRGGRKPASASAASVAQPAVFEDDDDEPIEPTPKGYAMLKPSTPAKSRPAAEAPAPAKSRPAAEREAVKSPAPVKAAAPAKAPAPAKSAAPAKSRPTAEREAVKTPAPAKAPAAAKSAAPAKRPPAPEMPEPVAKPEAVEAPPQRRVKKRRPAAEAAAKVEPAAPLETPEEEIPAPVKTPPKSRPAGAPGFRFGEIDLSPTTLAALEAAGYLEPTPVQAGVIPRALAGVDVMGQAHTGTGKTAAFAIPILERLHATSKSAGPQALVMVPTRELAVQVRDEFAKLAEGRRAHIVAVYGGKPIRKQTEQLQRGTDVIVGTPGRVLDHLHRRTLVLGNLKVVVLDEADRMLDIGFRPDIEKILRECPAARQTLLLSATLPPPVVRLAQRYMHDPESLDFSPTDIAVETIEQFYFTVDPENKFDLLLQLVTREQPRQAIIFCRTRRGTEKVGLRLSKKVDSVAAIHGDLAQRVRDRVMSQFREGKLRYLVATDVVGRGIDVSGISHIINFDIPEFCDDYVHRVGRTGRMGREGVAYSFVTPAEGAELTRIEVRINRLLKRDELPGFQAFNQPTLAAPSAAGESAEPAPPPASKPVFGRPQRRVRRAL